AGKILQQDCYHGRRHAVIDQHSNRRIYCSGILSTIVGDDDVELTAEKDSAFRRSTRWC
ncbi:hypothetical protein HAX54_014078, partial [Datura stramonium]|nr:hypothetical protein [Datura stramonium]